MGGILVVNVIKRFFWGNLDFPKIKKLNIACSNVWTCTKMWKQCYFYQSYTKKLFISYKISYYCCFGFSGNLEFPGFLQKRSITSTTGLVVVVTGRELQQNRWIIFNIYLLWKVYCCLKWPKINKNRPVLAHWYKTSKLIGTGLSHLKACQMGRLFQCQWTILLQFVTADHCDHIGLFFKDLQTNFLTKVAHIFGIFTANVKNCPFSEKTTATRYFWKLLKNWASFFQHLVTLHPS